jgi:hypothetical protein
MADKLKDRLAVGQWVKFRRSHDKAVELAGKIVRIHPGDDDCVDVEVAADGRIVEVSGSIETAHAADVTVIVVEECQDERLLEHIARDLDKLVNALVPRLSFVKIAFEKKGAVNMPPVQGPVVLNQGQATQATLLYFDQTGNPMPAGFVPPAVTYAIDNPAIASSAPESDGQTDDIAYVSAGVANLTATVQGPNGPLSDTETVTCNPVVVPPPVLSSVKIAFTAPVPPVAGQTASVKK